MRRALVFLRWPALVLGSLCLLVVLLCLPFYTGNAWSPYTKWRLEHGLMKIERSDNPKFRPRPFYLALNSEGLRWVPRFRRYGPGAWRLEAPFWIPGLLLTGLAYAGFRARRPKPVAGVPGAFE